MNARCEALSAAAAALAFAPSLGAPLQLDDAMIAAASRGSLAAPSLWTFLTGPLYYAAAGFGSWHPLPTALQLPLVGHPGSVFWLHALSVAVHSACAWLVAWIGGRLLGPKGGLAAGLVFALHPAHASAVLSPGWFAEPTAAFFALLSFAAFLRSSDGGGWVLLSGAAYGLGALSKEHVLVLPAAFLAWHFAFPDAKRPIRALTVGWAAAGAAYGFAVLALLRDVEGGAGVLPGLYVVDGPGPLARLAYLLKLLAVPAGTGPFHAWPGAAAFAPWGLLSAAVLAALGAAGRGAGGGAAAALGAAWMAAALWAPAAGSALPALSRYLSLWFVADRYVYLASAGFAWLAAAAFTRCLQGRARAAARRWAPAALAAALACYAGETAAAQILWSSPVANVEAAAEREPGAPMARFALGDVYLKQVRSFRKSAAEFEAAERLAPADRPFAAACRTGRAVALAGSGEEEEAERLVRSALEAYPAKQSAWGLLGVLQWAGGRREDAMRAFDAGVRADPNASLGSAPPLSAHELASLILAELARYDAGLARNPAFAETSGGAR